MNNFTQILGKLGIVTECDGNTAEVCFGEIMLKINHTALDVFVAEVPLQSSKDENIAEDAGNNYKQSVILQSSAFYNIHLSH